MGINISGVDFIPRLPDNTHNYTQKWAYSDIENEFGMLRMEYDIVDKWTAYASLGAQHAHEIGLYSASKLIDRAGNATAGRLDTNRYIDTASGMAGSTRRVRHRFCIAQSQRRLFGENPKR